MVDKNALNEKLDLIIKNQKKILKNEAKILKEEEKVEELELKELSTESVEISNEEETLKELSEIEKKIKKKVEDPIKKITKRDLVKGFVGAFIGTVSHFAFDEGYNVAEHLTILNATILNIVAFVIIILLLYYTGFRKVKTQKLILRFMPLRAVLIYCVSIFTIIFVYIIFGKLHWPFDFYQIYTLIGANIILAVLGAGTADLIGGKH